MFLVNTSVIMWLFPGCRHSCRGRQLGGAADGVAAGPAATYEFLHIYTYFRPISLQCIASTVRPHIFSYIVSSVIVVFLCWQLTTVGACYGSRDSWTSTPLGGVLVPYIPYTASSFPPHFLYGVLTSSSLHRRHPHFLLSSPHWSWWKTRLLVGL